MIMHIHNVATILNLEFISWNKTLVPYNIKGTDSLMEPIQSEKLYKKGTSTRQICTKQMLLWKNGN